MTSAGEQGKAQGRGCPRDAFSRSIPLPQSRVAGLIDQAWQREADGWVALKSGEFVLTREREREALMTNDETTCWGMFILF